MTLALHRRALLKGAAGAVALSTLGCFAARAQQARFRLYWWGNPDRNKRTEEAVKAYEASHPEVQIDPETLNWGDYWTRLATQMAGRNAPDLIQMDYRYLAEYAQRGALLPLDDFVGKTLQIGDFDAFSTASCTVDGKLYGVDLGNNSNAMMYDTSAFEKAKVDAPLPGTTWEKFAEITAAVTDAFEGKYFGTSDGSAAEPALENWLRQRGKALFTNDSQPGMDADDMAEWFQMWADMRKNKSCPPMDVQALDKQSIETNMLTTGRAACAFAHSNQLVAFQSANDKPIGITMYPQGAGPHHGHYLKPSMMWSVYSRTEVAEEVVKFINFTVAEPEGARILGVERGVPASPKIRDAVSEDLDDLGKAAVQYIGMVSERVGPIPPPPPKGAGEVEKMLIRVAQEVGFGRLTPSQGGKQYVEEARSILSRA